jgi:hypothetical protein
MAFLYPQPFPFCIQPEKNTETIPTGSGTNYPFGMSLADVMFLYWKAKTTQLSASLTSAKTITFDDFGIQRVINMAGGVSVNNSTITNIDIYGKWPVKMSQMICDTNQSFYSDKIVSGSASGTDYADGILVSQATYISSFAFLRMFYTSANNKIIIKNKKYFPYVNIGIGTVGAFDTNQFNFSAGTTPYSNQYIVKTNVAKIKINNTEYSADLFVENNLGGTYLTPDSASTSLTLTANNDGLAE